ncbi:domain found in IF2B/IF5-domain-containing protein [Pisolithus marmoratus]|nr:domain found in IF2B/IF5-domain-containing protein [Pisolithus marmoratus]
MPTAGIVNIRRDVDDKFYRYRMPLLLTKIEGKGNGIKTVIPNMSDVARALSRPPSYITKFFGCELGAQTPSDEKNDRYIVNGAHDADRLRELLDSFIDKFVLCASCKNPETDLVVIKSGRREDIFRDCKACGERTTIDMRHKLVTFILKNPPKNPKKAKKGKGEVTGNGNAGGVHASGPTIPGQEEDGSAGDTDDELTKKIRAEAANLTNDTTLGNDGWTADTSAEAVKARIKNVDGQIGGLSLTGGDDDGSEDDADSPYSQLWTGQSGIGSVQIYRKAEELGVEKKHKAVLVLVQALFTENIEKEISAYDALLVKIITSERHQKALLGGIERLAGLTYPELIPTIPKILMELYQVGVLDEEVVTQWGTHVSKKYVDKETSKKVRKASEPFLKWLEEADDESDEE